MDTATPNTSSSQPGPNDGKIADGEEPSFVETFSRRLQYEQATELDMNAGLESDESRPPVPEIRYEVCHPRPLTAHRLYNDYSHLDKFRTYFHYGRPM